MKRKTFEELGIDEKFKNREILVRLFGVFALFVIPFFVMFDDIKSLWQIIKEFWDSVFNMWVDAFNDSKTAYIKAISMIFMKSNRGK